MASFNFSRLATVYLNTLTEGSCVTGKRRYPDVARAAKALELAQLSRTRQPWRQECRIHSCADCRGVHLTSKPLGKAA